MDGFADVIDRLLQFLIHVGNVIVATVAAVELWLRAQLTDLNVPPDIQTPLLLALTALLILVSLRLLGGLIKVVVILVLILIAIHIAQPAFLH
ncbi:MAG: hypothetical protein P4L90_00860 [Rhodopila sp.]|nr:hypothetical protein [Rhodopila sp.]